MKFLLILLVCTSTVFSFWGCENQLSDGVRPLEPIPSSWSPHPENPASFDTPPKLVRGAAPIYPISQLQQNKAGAATIAFTIDEYGKTRDFRVISADYPYYASHAILAVQQWRFEPARKNGRPVAVRERVTFHYRIG
jgi:TonB family protein